MTLPVRPVGGELMDDLLRTEEELRGTLADLARINRIFGAHAFVRAYLDRALPVWRARRTHPSEPLTLLDVATGGADVPLAVARWARRRDVLLRIVAADRHPVTARLAREAAAAEASITVILADARALPFADGSFDVCLCTLALHHLSPAERPAFVRRLDGLARIGFLAIDLERGRNAYAAVWLMTRLSRSPLIRHDGPLSVARAMSRAEYAALARDAGVPGLRVSRLPWFRAALERLRAPDGAAPVREGRVCGR